MQWCVLKILKTLSIAWILTIFFDCRIYKSLLLPALDDDHPTINRGNVEVYIDWGSAINIAALEGRC